CLLDLLEAARRCSVMAGAEGKARVDFDGNIARFDLVAVVRAMDEETSGSHRLQTFQRMRDPIDVRQFLDGKKARPHQFIDPPDNFFGIVLDINRNLENLSVFIDRSEERRVGKESRSRW